MFGLQRNEHSLLLGPAHLGEAIGPSARFSPPSLAVMKRPSYETSVVKTVQIVVYPNAFCPASHVRGAIKANLSPAL